MYNQQQQWTQGYLQQPIHGGGYQQQSMNQISYQQQPMDQGANQEHYMQQDIYQKQGIRQQSMQQNTYQKNFRDQQHFNNQYQQPMQNNQFQQQQRYQQQSNSQYQQQKHQNQLKNSRSTGAGVSGLMKNDFGEMGAAANKFKAAESRIPKHEYDEDDAQSQNISRPSDNNVYRNTHNLTTWDDFGGGPIPNPYERFEDFHGLPPVQLNAFYNAGYSAPTPIQAQTWPIAMKERDVVSIAKTGSGKTLGFLLPAYMKIAARRNLSCISALVLAPTRELATQIQEEADKFGRVAGYYSACAYGGAPKRQQLNSMNAGISVLVATPGRLNDFLESGQVDLSSVFYLVLDEADRMLDMGFEPQIRTIIKALPRKRQTLMFSATWPSEVRRLASDFLYQPIHIRLGGAVTGLQANENIRQQLVLLRSGEEKDSELINLIRNRFSQNRDLVLIFVSRKNTCDFLTNTLNRVGIPASAMHGDREQKHRERTLAAFRDGTRPILVATDVASRGIDVKGISAVINYDLANSTEDYVHRIGRTGRAGQAGESFTFLTHSNDDIWKAVGIVEVMARTGQLPPPDVSEMINRLKQRQEQNKERRAAEDEQFAKVLIVAEKPSVAKMIAEHLSGGRFRTRRGKSRANQIFEFIKYFPPAHQKCKLMVTSVVGHIYGLGFARRPDKDISRLFDAETEKQVADSTKKLNIIEHLQELGAEAEYLFLWLDCDREGENIGFEVISLVQQWIHYDNVYRAKFSALTRTELLQAYENPGRPDKYAAMCVDARQELDLKIGVAFSRLMTRTFLDMAKEKFRLRDQKVVSYGPCQTPTLWFCVQRHNEIQKFKPTPFYVVSVVCNVQGRELECKLVNDTCDQQELQNMEAQIRASPNASIISVTESLKTVYKPTGLNTVTLLKSCSKGLGMSPTAAMSVAEHLYTSGYISYPRTETSKYPPSFDLVGVLQEQARHPNWGRIASYILGKGDITPSSRGFDAGDHPPITPMRCATREELKPNEWRIYDYVTRHFIATLHDDMQYMERTMLVDVNGFQFQYVWHEILDKGFMFSLTFKQKGLDLNEMNLPPVNQFRRGEPLQVGRFLKEERYTEPPDYLQESELISLMDKNGIGTDASIPTHIKNVEARHYVDVCGPSSNGNRGQMIQQKKFFGKNNRGGGRGGNQQQPRAASRHMVPRGFGLAFLSCFDVLDKELCEPTIRSYMEKQVSKIATGETDKNEVVSANLKLFKEKFIYFRANLERVNRYFAPKVQNFDGGNNDGFNVRRGGFNNGGRGRGGFNDGGGRGRGGLNDRGFGGFNDDGGRGRGRSSDRGRGSYQGRGGSRGGRGGYKGPGSNQGRGGFQGNWNSQNGERNDSSFDNHSGLAQDRFKSHGGPRGGYNNQESFVGQKRGCQSVGDSMFKRPHHSY